VAGASLLPQADSDRTRAAAVRTRAYFFIFVYHQCRKWM
jgi:hypothetical protein